MKTIFLFCFIFSSSIYHKELYAQSIIAQYNRFTVDSLMYSINPKGKLLSIKSDSVLIDGTSFSWKYHYSSFSGIDDTNYYFHTTKDSVVYDSLNQLILTGATYIKKSWIDSDSALILAEIQGGFEFRNNNPNYKITATLGEPLIPDSSPRWYINYISLDTPSNNFFINLDATDELTSVVESTEIPTDLILYQNYPNPFNPTTTIKFTIPRRGYIELKVYDLIGKEIRTLVRGNRLAGNHFVQFNGRELSSGIYLYKLEFSSFSKVKKFVLLK